MAKISSEIVCRRCGNLFYSKRKRQFCSQSCSSSRSTDKVIEVWKNGGSGYTGKAIQTKISIRRYLIHKHNNKCQKCGWCEINKYTNKVPLELHHIDGNAENCTEENYEVLCPNCHSLTPNFRNCNQHSQRKRSVRDSNSRGDNIPLVYKTSDVDR